MDFTVDDLLSQITYKTSRSGGKGGQNVNKVSSKVELNFDFESSPIFSDEEKRRIKQKLANRMTSIGSIQVIAEEERSQFLNKEKALVKLNRLLKAALLVAKPRKATKIKKSAVEKRLKNKQQNALKKLNRSSKGFER